MARRLWPGQKGEPAKVTVSLAAITRNRLLQCLRLLAEVPEFFLPFFFGHGVILADRPSGQAYNPLCKRAHIPHRARVGIDLPQVRPLSIAAISFREVMQHSSSQGGNRVL